MSMFEIKMPKLGESITEGTIISWSVKVGDIIKEDDVLFEVNTAKVSAEIPAPVAGKVVEILFKEGDTVPVGTVVALVDIGNEAGEFAESPAEKPKEESPARPLAEASVSQPQPIAEVPQPSKPSKGNEDRWYSPIVLQLAKEAGISNDELESISGTGYEGRLSKKDIKDYIDRKKKGIPAATGNTPAEKKTTVEAKPAAPEPQPAISHIQVGKEDEVREMDYVRRLIADHMVMSKRVSPHVTTVIEVDATKMVQWRDKNKETFFKREGVKLTYMPVIASVTAKALADYPMVNSSVDGYNIILKKHINMGIAVSLNNGNLIVPVVHDADKLNVNGLATSIDSLAIKARNNKLSPNDIDGGTFTITNYGTFKSLFGTPIINQPQVAILGIGSIEKKPAVIETPEGDVIAIRHKMYLSLSYDHRVVDGSLGGMFLKRIADYIESWNG